MLALTLLLLTPNSLMAEDNVSFCRDVAPILLKSCVVCHGPNKREGGYRVDTYEHALAVGDSEIPGFVAHKLLDSEAYRRIVSEDESERMPVEAAPLPQSETVLLQRWINQGTVFDGKDTDAPLGSLIPPPNYAAPPVKYRAPISVAAMQFSSDGQQLIVGGYYELTVWNPNNGTLVRRIPNVAERTMAMSLHPNGRTLAVAGGQPGIRGEVRIIDLPSGLVTGVPCVASDVFLDVAFSPNGKQLAASGADATIRVLDIGGHRDPLTITGYSDWVTAVAWNQDGSRLASASRDKSAKVLDIKSGKPLVSYSGHETQVLGIAWVNESSQICTLDDNGKIHRWDTNDGKKVADFSAGGRGLKLQSVNGQLFACLRDGRLLKFDLEKNKPLREFRQEHPWALSLARNPLNNELAGGTIEGFITIWDVQSQKRRLTFIAAPGHTAKRH
jgi:hypothetical protein